MPRRYERGIIGKNEKAPERFCSGAKFRRAFAARSSRAHCLALSLSRAVCSPTPLSAACGCLGLMAGPFRPFPVGIYRVRPLRPVRSLPAGSGSPDVVRTRLQFLISRVGTFTTGTAPAFGRTLAPRYGSDLLTLRLHSLLQWGDAFFRAAPIEEVRELCQAHSLPAVMPPLRALLVRASGAFWRGGPAGKRNCVLVCAVATKTLWGNCVGAQVETSCGPDSACVLFLIAACRSAPGSCELTGHDSGSEELVISACRCCLRSLGGEGDTSCRRPFPGRPGLSQSRSRRFFQVFALRLFYQGTSRIVGNQFRM